MIPFYQKIPRTKNYHIPDMTVYTGYKNAPKRKELQLELWSTLGPVHASRGRKARSQHLHRGRAGPQLHVSCPHSWRCHWGIHGELQKVERGKRKLRYLISSSHPPYMLFSNTARGCPAQPCSHLPEALPHLPVAQLTLSSSITFPTCLLCHFLLWPALHCDPHMPKGGQTCPQSTARLLSWGKQTELSRAGTVSPGGVGNSLPTAQQSIEPSRGACHTLHSLCCKCTVASHWNTNSSICSNALLLLWMYKALKDSLLIRPQKWL